MSMRSVRLVSLFALTGILSAPLVANAAADGTGAPMVPGEVLVGYGPSRFEVRSASSAIGEVGAVSGFDTHLRAARVKLRPGITVSAAIARLAGRPGVSYVEPNYVVRTCATPNDPAFASKQYVPQKVQADKAWDIWKPKAKVVIAVLDTGVQATHPDLVPVMYRDQSGDVIGWNSLANTSAFADDGGHGTHSAGVALGHINDGTGLAGLSGWNPSVQGSDGYLRLMPVKALDAGGFGSTASVAAGITWAVNHGAQVISISAATASSSTALNDAVKYAWDNGCVIVAAAGNSQSSAPMYPAACPNVISVAASDNTDTLAYYTQYGSWIKCVAPGSNVHGTYKNSAYANLTGTSTAAPHVAAEAAAIMSQNPTLSNDDVSSLITGQVDGVTLGEGQSLAVGVGRINVYRALLAAGDGLPNLTSVSFNPGEVANKTNSTGTVLIGGPAPTGGVVVTLTSMNTSVATVPSSVTIPAGETSVSFTATGKLVASNNIVTIKATANNKTVSGTLQVNGSIVKSITLDPFNVYSGGSFTGTVTLDAPAPDGGAVVSLTDNGGSTISRPATFIVPAGSTTGSFNGTANTVTLRTSVTIYAHLNGATVKSYIIVNPAGGLSSVTVNPTTTKGGINVTGKVTLSVAAPTGGLLVNLSSSSSATAKVPVSVTVSAGATTASFPITTYAVNVSKTVTISATSNGSSKTASLTVTPMLKSVVVNPGSVIGGTKSTGTVNLAAPAPAGGAEVSLASNSGAATVPSSVTVPEGATSVSFSISTSAVSVNTTATITGSHAGATATAKVTVKSPVMSKVTLLPTIVIGGTPSVGTVTLTGIAPAGGMVVTLASNNAAADVPASVTVPAGAKTAVFTVTTNTVVSSVIATISGTTGSVMKSAALTINPLP